MNGGESEPTQASFTTLVPKERAAVLAFLASL